MPGSELSKRPIPENAEEWLQEIAEAYADAEDALPFTEILGDTIEEELLFTIAPMVALKFRGIPYSEQNRTRATDAALASYAANKELHPAELADHRFGFALAYLASHHGLDLVSPSVIDEVLEYVNVHRRGLAALVDEGER